MALFRITNPTIKVVPQGKQNAGKKFFYALLVNTNCPWEQPRAYTNFSDYVVAEFSKYLSVAHGGTLAEDKELPAELSMISGHFVDYTPPQKFHKIHLTAHAARPATPTSPARDAINIGDIVSRNGVPIVYDTLRVFCQYYTDENGERQYVEGSDPITAGQRAFMAYCIPVNSDPAPQTVESPTDEIPY